MENAERSPRALPVILSSMGDGGRSTTGVAVLVRLSSSNAPGRLSASFEPVEEGRALAAPSDVLLLLRMWRESNDVVRGALSHPASSRVVYFQGKGEMIEFARALGLRLSRVGMT